MFCNFFQATSSLGKFCKTKYKDLHMVQFILVRCFISAIVILSVENIYMNVGFVVLVFNNFLCLGLTMHNGTSLLSL